MLDQRRRRWTDAVRMLYKCFEFAGSPCVSDSALLTVELLIETHIRTAFNNRGNYHLWPLSKHDTLNRRWINIGQH